MYCLAACGTTKKNGTTKKQEKKSLILPPDVNSNKYSKKRNHN
jgi:hypothetical protein